MTTIIKNGSIGEYPYTILTKGAPEVLKELFDP